MHRVICLRNTLWFAISLGGKMRNLSIFSYLLLALSPVIGQASLRVANSCPYRLVTFKNEAGERRFGLEPNLGSEVPHNLWDVTSKVESLILGSDGNIDLNRFYSDGTQAELGQTQCRLLNSAETGLAESVQVRPEQILAAIPQPTNIVAMGLNARSHAEQLGRDAADGFIFPKNVAMTGAFAEIVRPAKALLDYEVELGVVFRKEITPGTNLTPENLREYVAGFVLTNDVSNRTPIVLDKFDGSFTLAKTYPSFLPTGPYYVPIESLNLPVGALVPELEMRLTVRADANATVEDVRQLGNTKSSDFYVDLAAAVTKALNQRDEISLAADGSMQKLLRNGKFEAGDLLLMGTIAGTALRLNPRLVWESTLRASRYEPGSAFDFFWPVYSRYFSNFGGPPIINTRPQLMALKTHWAREEYCNNDLYLKAGQIVTNSITGLGKQINTVTNGTDADSLAEQSEMADAAKVQRLCQPREGARPQLRHTLWQAPAISVGGSVAAWAGSSYFLPWRWARITTRTVSILGALAYSGNEITSSAWSAEPNPADAIDTTDPELNRANQESILGR